jgi:hypothetical protein
MVGSLVEVAGGDSAKAVVPVEALRAPERREEPRGRPCDPTAGGGTWHCAGEQRSSGKEPRPWESTADHFYRLPFLAFGCVFPKKGSIAGTAVTHWQVPFTDICSGKKTL